MSTAQNDIVYFNLSLTNNAPENIKARIIDQRFSDIISRPNEYEMSVVRFQVDTSFIPLFYAEIPDEKFPDVTISSITLQYGGVNFREFVTLTPNQVAFGVYNYNLFLERVNLAFETAFVALKLAFPLSSPNAAPWVSLDPVTKLLSMYVQSYYLESDPGHIDIFCNTHLLQYLNLPVVVFNGPDSIDGTDAQLAVKDYAVLMSPTRVGAPVFLNSIPGTLLQVSQEFTIMNAWSSLDKLVFISNLLPIVNELVPTSQLLNQNENFSNNSRSILTDFVVPKTQSDVLVRGLLEYIPQAEYRMISLQGINPIRTIDIQCYWQDYLGVLREVQLSHNKSMSVKLMFRRK